MSYLELVSCELSVVPEYLVVTGPAGALDALVAQQVEISLQDKDNQEDKPSLGIYLRGMVDPLVHHSPGQGVPIAILVIVSREKSELTV